jgi:predicted transcriptional regulator
MEKRQNPPLSAQENAVMRILWKRRKATAEVVRSDLAPRQALKDSTIRTVLRRLEVKGYATHELDGRTFIYAPCIESENVAVSAVRGIIDRFCQGSVETLLVGLVDNDLISPQTLKQLSERISRAEETEKRQRSTKRR